MQNNSVKYCPICGCRISGNGNFCPQCGSRLSYTNIQTKSSNSAQYWVVVVAGLIIVLFLIAYFDDSPSTYSFTPSSVVNTIRSQQDIQSIKDIDEMRKAINGTIWTYTETGNFFWYKLVFKDKTVKYYSAMPSDGHWNFEEECEYALEEGRYIDDGRRYIAAVFKSKDLDIPARFSINNGHLYILGLDIAGFVLGDYEWD